jgi:hypothetical protein
MRTAIRVPRFQLHAVRTYRSTPAFSYPYKDSQDRESLKPRSSEHTKSGRDDDAAAAPKAAFGRDTTSPEEERETASREDGGDLLEVSGANQDLSKPQGDETSDKKFGAGKEVRKGGRSGGGSAPKKGDANNRY